MTQALRNASSKDDSIASNQFCAIVNQFMVKKLPPKRQNIWYFPNVHSTGMGTLVMLLYIDYFCDVLFTYYM